MQNSLLKVIRNFMMNLYHLYRLLETKESQFQLILNARRERLESEKWNKDGPFFPILLETNFKRAEIVKYFLPVQKISWRNNYVYTFFFFFS